MQTENIRDMELKKQSTNQNSVLVFFTVGFVSQTAQIIILREVFKSFLGNEIAFGVTFAIWLIFQAAGATALSLFSKNENKIFKILFLALIIYFPLARHLLSVWTSWINLPSGQVVPLFHGIIFTSAIAGPLIFICGALFSAALNYNQKLALQPNEKVYVHNATGELVAGLLFSFVFSAFLSHYQVIVICLLLIIVSQIPKANRRFSLTIVTIISLALLYYAPLLDFASSKVSFKAKNEMFKLIDSVSSQYGEISVVKTTGSSQKDFFINGNYYFSYCSKDQYSEAASAHSILCLHPAPKNILIFGNMPVLKEVLLHPVESIDFVEIDPALVKTYKKHICESDKTALNDERLQIINADPAAFTASKLSNTYDMVISFAPKPVNLVSNRLYTQEFFKQVKRVLKPCGKLVVPISTDPSAQSERLALSMSVNATLKSVFQHTKPTPAGLTIASDIIFDVSFTTLKKRYNSRNIDSELFHPFLFETIFDLHKQKAINDLIQKPETQSKINLVCSPVMVLKSLRVYRHFSSDADRQIYNFFEHIRFEYFIFYALVVFLTSFYPIKKQQKPSNLSIYLAVFNCGFFAISLGIMTLFVMQSTVGAAYSLVGAQTGAFMAGIIIGSYIVIKKIIKGYYSFVALLFYGSLIALTPVALLHLHTASVYLTLTAIFIISILSGAITGAVYQTALILMSKTAKAASRIYATDLLGAVAGAILSGTGLLLNHGIFTTSICLSCILVATSLRVYITTPLK